MPLQRLRRWLFFTVVLGTAATGGWLMLGIVEAGGISALELTIVALFVPTFGWISIAFWSAIVGFCLQLGDRNPLTLARIRPPAPVLAPLRSRTALVMPAHNEDPRRVMGGLAATLQSLRETGHGRRFDTFLLSDTTDPEIAALEEEEWNRLLRDLSSEGRLTYRRRPDNAGRKSGNLWEFCERWGEGYDLMVVLDADSVMDGLTLVELVRLMEANPGAGLIQTVPLPARQATLFGRLLQFAASLYSVLHATGQSWWQGDAANYWGHNAIVRLSAFREHARLPVVPGDPPLGGEVLSHDFVEAALLRRAGWRVYLASWLGGSFEEVPENLPDYAKRDRRWTQGSLQHLRLLRMDGLHPLSRVHFVMGAMGYLSSVLWLLLLLAGSAYVTLAETDSSPLWTEGLPWMAELPDSLSGPPLSLLLITATLLFLPKLLGWLVGLLRHRDRMGGAIRLTVSALLEGLFAVVVAPVLMIHHAGFVVGVLAGRDVTWDGRTRGGSIVSWRGAWNASLGTVMLGVGWAGLTIYTSWIFLLWLSPILIGLLLAPALIHWTSREDLGARTRDRGLLLVASETEGSHMVAWPVDRSVSGRGPPDPLMSRSGRPAAAGARTRRASVRASSPTDP